MNGRLTISLGALAANYRQLCETASGAVAAVVKADAYGLGADHVGVTLWRNGCRDFFVATHEEGIALRGVLADARIFVLEGAVEDTCNELRAHGLTPVLNTQAQLEAWAPQSAPCAVHVDTGMQRLGLPWAQAAEACLGRSLQIELLITHMARADEPGHASITEQTQRIAGVYDALKARWPELRLSVSNSAGLCEGLGPEHLGRAGVGLYGGNPFVHQPNPQHAVARLEGRVLQLRDIGANVPVGYGGSFVSRSPMRIATLGVGYADGVPRLMSNCGRVYFEGQFLPIVGRVSMDLMQVDATDTGMREGDWVEVMGAHVTVDEVAAHAGTISYEVLTGLGRRLLRSYTEALLD